MVYPKWPRVARSLNGLREEIWDVTATVTNPGPYKYDLIHGVILEHVDAAGFRVLGINCADLVRHEIIRRRHHHETAS